MKNLKVEPWAQKNNPKSLKWAVMRPDGRLVTVYAAKADAEAHAASGSLRDSRSPSQKTSDDLWRWGSN